jgi:2-phosphosulfolactate phosphatase
LDYCDVRSGRIPHPLEWGLRGLRELAPVSDVVVIVDVLSFSTALDIATSRGATVFPYPLKDGSAAAYAASLQAQLAVPDRDQGPSLSPASLQSIAPGTRLVLPSPNGAALAFSSNHSNFLAACFRNATAAATLAAALGNTIAVIPAGETWDTGELRPCLEDLAAAAFHRVRANLPEFLRACSSGKELIERGFLADVDLAAELDVSTNVPYLRGRAFVGPANPNAHQSRTDHHRDQ